MPCRIRRRAEWTLRILLEAQLHTESCFATLTYDPKIREPENLEMEQAQRFLKRLRKLVKKKIRYFLVGEYGEKRFHPHYHACLFGLGYNQDSWELVKKAWNTPEEKGFIHLRPLDMARAKYVARYTTKKLSKELSAERLGKEIPEFANMSRRPGLAHGFILTVAESVKRLSYWKELEEKTSTLPLEERLSMVDRATPTALRVPNESGKGVVLPLDQYMRSGINVQLGGSCLYPEVRPEVLYGNLLRMDWDHEMVLDLKNELIARRSVKELRAQGTL